MPPSNPPSLFSLLRGADEQRGVASTSKRPNKDRAAAANFALQVKVLTSTILLLLQDFYSKGGGCLTSAVGGLKGPRCDCTAGRRRIIRWRRGLVCYYHFQMEKTLLQDDIVVVSEADWIWRSFRRRRSSAQDVARRN